MFVFKILLSFLLAAVVPSAVAFGIIHWTSGQSFVEFIEIGFTPGRVYSAICIYIGVLFIEFAIYDTVETDKHDRMY